MNTATPTSTSAGARFRAAVATERPLQVVGAINANHALLAKHAGFKAIYVSGGGVAAGSLGLPDLGISNLDDVLTDIRRITDVCDLPLLVDVDTGFGPSAFNVARTVRSRSKIEKILDQVQKCLRRGSCPFSFNGQRAAEPPKRRKAPISPGFNW